MNLDEILELIKKYDENVKRIIEIIKDQCKICKERNDNEGVDYWENKLKQYNELNNTSNKWINEKYRCNGICEKCDYGTEDTDGNYYCDESKIDINKVDYPVPNKFIK